MLISCCQVVDHYVYVWLLPTQVKNANCILCDFCDFNSGLSYILVSVLVLGRAINPPDANAISNAKRTPDGVAEYEAVDSHTRSTTGPPCLKHYAGNQFPRAFTVELRPVVFT